METKDLGRWYNLIGAVLDFYDAVKPEPGRDRKLFNKHLDQMVLAIKKDLENQKEEQ